MYSAINVLSYQKPYSVMKSNKPVLLTIGGIVNIGDKFVDTIVHLEKNLVEFASGQTASVHLICNAVRDRKAKVIIKYVACEECGKEVTKTFNGLCNKCNPCL